MSRTKKLNIVFVNLIIMAFVLCGLGSLSILKPSTISADVTTPVNDLAINVDLVSAPTPTATSQKTFEETYYTTAGEGANQHIVYTPNGNITTLSGVKNGGIIQLNNEAIDNKRQALYIHAEKNTDKSVIIQSVDLRLNGQTLLHNWVSNAEENYLFNQYLFGIRASELDGRFAHQDISDNPAENVNMQTGFATTKCSYGTGQNSYNPSDASNLEAIEGKYYIRINYSVVNSDSQQAAGVAEFEFIMYRDDTFKPTNQQPTFNNTSQPPYIIENLAISKVNYFNFKTSNTSAPALPTLTFNPNKFSLKYTYSRYSQIQEEYETAFDPDAGVFTITNMTTGAVSTYTFPTNTQESEYSVTIVFDEVGEYNFEKTAYLTYKTLVNGSFETTRQIITTDDVGASNDILQSETLIINGYMAQFALDSTTYAPMYDETYESTLKNETKLDKIYSHKIRTGVSYEIGTPTTTNKIYTADFTFATTFPTDPTNEDDSIVIDTDVSDGTILSTTLTKRVSEKDGAGNTTEKSYVYTINNSTINNELINIATTNLPPVTFNFYGKINTARSWYFFKKYGSSDFTSHNYVANMSFKNPGEYYVCLSFENIIDTLMNKENPTYCEQMFHFIITNNQAQVKLKEKTSTDTDYAACPDLTSQFTNKNVFVAWEESGPFDARITVKYSTDNGLTYLPLSGSAAGYTTFNGTTINDTPTELMADGTYLIKVYKSNTPQYAVNYKFTIDKTPPQGVVAYGITNNNTLDRSTILSSDSNFNLIVNRPFAWSWDDNTVSARYFFASITKTDPETVVKSSNPKIVPTDYTTSFFSSPIEYIKATENEKLNTLNQIISSPQIAILMLTDLAGNTSTFITILDTTEANILCDSSDLGNIKSTTSFTWGTHKSISINKDSTDNSTNNLNSDINDLIEAKDGWTWGNKEYTFSDTVMAQLNNYITTENIIIIPVKSVQIIKAIGVGATQSTTENALLIPQENEPSAWKLTIKIPETITYSSRIITYLDDAPTNTILSEVTDLSGNTRITF